MSDVNEKSELKLNLEMERVNLAFDNIVVPSYKEFCGKNIEQMPLMIKSNRQGLGVLDILKRRVELANIPFQDPKYTKEKSQLQTYFEETWQDYYENKKEALQNWKKVRQAWWENDFDTIDAILEHPNNNDFKIQLNSPTVNNAIIDKLIDGAVALGTNRETSINLYHFLEGESFKKSELEKYINTELTLNNVLRNPVFAILIPDENLFEEYVRATFKLGKELEPNKNHFYHKMIGIYHKMIGMWLDDSQKKLATKRWWSVGNLKLNSAISGDNFINADNGRIVGKAEPETIQPEIYEPKLDKVENYEDFLNKLHV